MDTSSVKFTLDRSTPDTSTPDRSSVKFTPDTSTPDTSSVKFTWPRAPYRISRCARLPPSACIG